MLGSMSNILSWNCRGAGARSFPCLIQDLKRSHNVQMLIIIEPRISGVKADKIITKLGYDYNYRVEAEGFSGGIWLLWDKSNVNIHIINNSSQLLHTKVSFQNERDEFFLTCVYGSPTPSVRQGLWSQLEDINKTLGNSDCVCIGDFC